MNVQGESPEPPRDATPASARRVTGFQAEGAGEDEIDLRAILMMLWRGRWLLLVSAILAVAAALLVVSGWEERYQASAKILFNPEQRKVTDLDSVLQTDGGRNAVANQIEILRSTALMERVVDKLGFRPPEEPEPEAGEEDSGFSQYIAGFIPVPRALEGTLRDLGILPPPPDPLTPEERKRRARLSAINGLRNNIRLRQVEFSRVIEISYVSTDPRWAARVVNTVAEQYIVDRLEARLEATRSATEWLSTRVDDLRTRVQEAEQEVEAARADLVEKSGQGLEVLRNQLSARSGDLAQLRNRLSEAEARQTRISEALAAERDFGTVAEFRSSDVISRYRETERELLSQRANLERSVGPEHPARQRLRLRLEEVRRNIREEAERIAVSLADQLEAMRAREEDLVAEIRGLEERVLKQSRSQLEVRQLEREAEASRALYENLLARLKETSAQEDLQSADARILSPAEIPTAPLSSRKTLVVAAAGVMGLMGGIGILVVLDQLNNTFRTREDLEAASGVRVLATLPLVGRRLRPWQVIRRWREKPNSALGETVRNLRTAIMRSNLDAPPGVVMLTSSVPEEGKSTTAMLLAMTTRQMGKKVIIVDCDLRKPALARLLDVDDQELPGLVGVLEGRASVDEAIRVEEELDLHLLMSRAERDEGTVNAADILSTNRFGELVRLLSEHYDLVILDTPPTLVVADARIVASHADAVVYTVRWDSTPRGAALEGLKELRAVNAPIAGLALTMVHERRASKYSYSGYGYYAHRYRSYYVNS